MDENVIFGGATTSNIMMASSTIGLKTKAEIKIERGEGEGGQLFRHKYAASQPRHRFLLAWWGVS
jgi:hypothetical protein